MIVRYLDGKFVCAICLLSIVNTSFAWNSVGTYTHDKLADDAVNEINAADYPDIHRFAEELRDGAETEAHYPPGIPGTEHRWWPAHEDWWNKDDDPNKKCALQWYDEYDFHNTYLTVGYLLHLVQDRRVPAHLYRIIHGFWLDGNPTDDFEDYVDGSAHYGFASGSTPWTFVDNQNRTWYYWLSDAMDDDDEDDVADGAGGGGTIWDDGSGNFMAEWGLSRWEFGSYGYGDYLFGFDPLPGKHEGTDYFQQYPNDAIAHEQLKKARDDSILQMKAKSEALPPLVPDDATHGEPSISEKIFGPNSDPVDIEFIAMENRKKTIYVSVLAGSTAIEDTSSKTWDGGSGANYDLPSESDTDQLPWKGTLTLSWDGTLSSGDLDDGQHTIAMKVKDEDGNESEERTRTVKYDKTKPSGSITVTVSP